MENLCTQYMHFLCFFFCIPMFFMYSLHFLYSCNLHLIPLWFLTLKARWAVHSLTLKITPFFVSYIPCEQQLSFLKAQYFLDGSFVKFTHSVFTKKGQPSLCTCFK